MRNKASGITDPDYIRWLSDPRNNPCNGIVSRKSNMRNKASGITDPDYIRWLTDPKNDPCSG